MPLIRTWTFHGFWLLLAGWLALWPAVEAREAELRLAGRPLRPAVEAAGGCCGSAVPFDAGGDDGGGCGRVRSESPARPVSCPEGGSTRCLQCHGPGGPVMFAQSLVVPEPERAVLGAIHYGDHVAASRDLRPPVPPPRTDVVIRT